MSMMKTNRKPPLPKSPIRLRPRRVLRSNSTVLQTPPGSLTKSEKPIRSWKVEGSEIRSVYHSVSCELRDLAKIVKDEFRGGESEKATADINLSGANSTPLFERGRFYDEYSERRNERLKRKKGEAGDELKTPHKLGVNIESSKRRDSKKLESLRKTAVAAANPAERSENPRFSLRSMSRENEKPPLTSTIEKSGITKIGARRGRRI